MKFGKTISIGAGMLLAAAALAHVATWVAAGNGGVVAQVDRGHEAPMAETAGVPAQAALPAHSRVVFDGWSFAGPTNVGADVASLVPGQSSSELYALSRSGTVFRSTDGAAHWAPVLTVPSPGNGMEQLTILPANGTRPLTMFVREGLGLYRVVEGQAPEAIRYDVSNVLAAGNLVYIAASNGLFVSDDAGSHWQQVIQADYDCSDIAPAGTKVYAVCDDHFYRSVAGGAFVSIAQESAFSYGRLAVSRSNPDIVYLSNSDGEGGVWLYRSANAGTSWTLVLPPWDPNPMHQALLDDFEADCAGTVGVWPPEKYAFAVDPVNPDVVWLGAYQLYRSNNGGATFGRASLGPDAGQGSHVVPAGDHDIVFPANYNGSTVSTMYVATAGGVYATNNGAAAVQTYPATTCETSSGAPAVDWVRKTEGYQAHQVVLAEALPNGEVLSVLGGGSGGLYYGNLDDPDGWERLLKQQPEAIALYPKLVVDRFYTTPCTEGSVCRWDWSAASAKWEITESPYIVEQGSSYIQAAKFLVIDPRASSRIWTASTYRALRTDDAFATWSYKDNTPKGWGLTVAAVSPRDSNIVLTAGGGGDVFRREDALSIDGSAVWAKSDLATGDWAARSLTFDPSQPDNVYLTGSRSPAVFASRDAGKTWQAADVTGAADGLPDSDVLSLAVDPDVSDVVYAGTRTGLYVTWNHTAVGGGAPVWHEVPTPFGDAPVQKLVIRKAADGSRKLYAFTNGRGIWVSGIRAAQFNDVALGRWSYDAVSRLYRAGITGGCGAYPARYCPEAPVLRDQMAVFLLRAKYGRTFQPGAAQGVFVDVPLNQWAAGWIERLRQDGITGGCVANPLQYCPGQPVLREQMAVFLLRAKHGSAYQPPPATGMFADVPQGYWAAAWIEQLARESVTGGCSNAPKLYCPTAQVTREQMAVFLVRAFAL